MSTKDRNGQEWSIKFDRNPDECPMCHHGIEPKDMCWSRVTNAGTFSKDARLERIFLCPRGRCDHFFIARYYESHHSQGYYTFHSCVPAELTNSNFSEEVRASTKSRTNAFGRWPRLSKIAGISDEDYLTSLRPSDAENIKTTPLAGCIRAYAGDSRIKSTAARAAWLGNDETHYVRKWEDKDLDDLKKLIALTLNWIQAEDLTKEAVSGMPTGR